MSFGTYARRVRDDLLPVPRRHTALRCAVERYCPLGFTATWAYIATTALPQPDLRRDPGALLRALDILEASRATWLREVDAFAATRRAEKAVGRRTPHPSQLAHLSRPRWPGETTPSRLGLVAAVASSHADFRRFPHPDETLYGAGQARRLADLHAALASCASAYLTQLGRLNEATYSTLSSTTQAIRDCLRPGYAPLNSHLIAWLRFADLLGYAARCHLDRGV